MASQPKYIPNWAYAVDADPAAAGTSGRVPVKAILLEFLRGKLSEADVAIVEGIIDSGEDAGDPTEMASDAAIIARRRGLFDDGKLTYDALHAPIHRPMSDAERKEFLERFPDAERLK